MLPTRMESGRGQMFSYGSPGKRRSKDGSGNGLGFKLFGACLLLGLLSMGLSLGWWSSAHRLRGALHELEARTEEMHHVNDELAHIRNLLHSSEVRNSDLQRSYDVVKRQSDDYKFKMEKYSQEALEKGKQLVTEEAQRDQQFQTQMAALNEAKHRAETLQQQYNDLLSSHDQKVRQLTEQAEQWHREADAWKKKEESLHSELIGAKVQLMAATMPTQQPAPATPQAGGTVPVPVPIPTQVPYNPAPSSLPYPMPTPTRIPTPVPNPTHVPIPVPNPTQVPTPVPNPIPTQQVPVPNPNPTQVPYNPIPTPVPDPHSTLPLPTSDQHELPKPHEDTVHNDWDHHHWDGHHHDWYDHYDHWDHQHLPDPHAAMHNDPLHPTLGGVDPPPHPETAHHDHAYMDHPDPHLSHPQYHATQDVYTGHAVPEAHHPHAQDPHAQDPHAHDPHAHDPYGHESWEHDMMHDAHWDDWHDSWDWDHQHDWAAGDPHPHHDPHAPHAQHTARDPHSQHSAHDPHAQHSAHDPHAQHNAHDPHAWQQDPTGGHATSGDGHGHPDAGAQQEMGGWGWGGHRHPPKVDIDHHRHPESYPAPGEPPADGGHRDKIKSDLAWKMGI